MEEETLLAFVTDELNRGSMGTTMKQQKKYNRCLTVKISRN